MVSFGKDKYYGVVTESDIDKNTGRTIYRIQYSDGDHDDRFVEEFQFMDKVPSKHLAILKKKKAVEPVKKPRVASSKSKPEAPELPWRYAWLK
jgi:hypothetical protein